MLGLDSSGCCRNGVKTVFWYGGRGLLRSSRWIRVCYLLIPIRGHRLALFIIFQLDRELVCWVGLRLGQIILRYLRLNLYPSLRDG